MEHEYSDDEWGFWEPDRTRRLPRLRGGEPTRALERVRPGSRHHGAGAALTTTGTSVGAHVDHDVDGAHHVLDEELFDDLGPADEFPGLDDLLGTAAVPVVTTTRRSWRQRLRRDDRGRVDPFIARLGVVLLAGVVVLPVAVAANVGVPGTNGAVSTGTAVAAAAPVATTALAPATAAAPATVDQTPGSAQPAATAGATSPTGGTAAEVATSAERAQSARESLRRCASSYEVLPGDYWLGIADRADVDVDDLLAANGAATDTPLYPERSICLPAGATTPVRAPATTAATTAETHATSTDAAGSTAAAAAKAATTDAPASTKAATTTPATTPATKAPATAPATTKAPATTAKPTTTTAAPTTTTQPPRTYSRDEVAQIIRDVWPEDLEDKAIAVATRESNLQPGVRNYCCFGLFQIYFEVHDGWLAAMGVTQATQLYDPLVNAQAALALYFRSGGWGPWGG